MGIGVDEALGQTGHVHNFPHPLVNALLVPAVIELLDNEGGGNRFADGHAGVEGGKGVLEDDLHLPAQLLHLLGAQGQHVPALEEHLAAGGFVEAQDSPAHGGLSAAGLAYHAQGFARMDGKTDVVHRMEHSVRYREVFLQVFNP